MVSLSNRKYSKNWYKNKIKMCLGEIDAGIRPYQTSLPHSPVRRPMQFHMRTSVKNNYFSKIFCANQAMIEQIKQSAETIADILLRSASTVLPTNLVKFAKNALSRLCSYFALFLCESINS